MQPITAGSETIVYPDSDGKPMAENTLQFRWIVTIEGGLDFTFLHDPNVFVAGDLLWYPVRGNPKIRMAPDALVVFGRPKGERGSYRQWEERGISPQVVFEILSPGNRAGELARKFRFYQRYGVQEYYIYDPDRGTLRGWLREARGLVEVPEMAGFASPLLGIRFEPGEGPDNLAIFRPDGSRFQTFNEISEDAQAQRQQAEAERRKAEAERRKADAERRKADVERRKADAERLKADAESQRADTESQRADTESQRAEAERQKAARYLAKLRELGIEPD